jgi:hypothetical protein
MASTRSAAAVFLGFFFAGLTQARSLLLGSFVVLNIQLLLQLPRQLHKNLLYVVAILRRTLHINQVFLSTELLYFFLLHFPLVH